VNALLDPIRGLLLYAGLAAVLLAAVVVLFIYQQKLLRRYRTLLQGSSVQNIEELLLTQADEIHRLRADLQALDQTVHEQGQDARKHIQRVGIVRFNAFADTGSDLSFAIALLDANLNGIVISSLYARTESRIYAKPVLAGKSTYALSDEEKEAIARATGR
jgi:hypothetical protein